MAGALRLVGLRLAPRDGSRVAHRSCPPTRSCPRTSKTSRARRRTSRRASHMPPAKSWRADRPGDLEAGSADRAAARSPGPNVGYALSLAERVRDRLTLAPHESRRRRAGGHRRDRDEAGRALRPGAGDDRHRHRRRRCSATRARSTRRSCTWRTHAVHGREPRVREATRDRRRGRPTRCSACRPQVAALAHRVPQRELRAIRRPRRLIVGVRCSPHEQLELRATFRRFAEREIAPQRRRGRRALGVPVEELRGVPRLRVRAARLPGGVRR